MRPRPLLVGATALAVAAAAGACASSYQQRGSHAPAPVARTTATTAPAPASAPVHAAAPVVRTTAPAYVAPPPAAAAAGAGGFAAQDLPVEAALEGGRAAGKPVAMFFLARWCGFCQRLQANTLPDPSVQAAMGTFYSVRYDPDSVVGRQASARYNSHAFPTVVILDSSGAERTRIVGYEDPARFAAELSRAR